MIGDGMTDFESCPPAVSSHLFINKSLLFLFNFFRISKECIYWIWR